jgi:two-component system response regulator HydG
VSATNLNLEEAVAAGEFRSDLYHRLTQIHLQLPPLRERPDDVAALAELFLHQQDPASRFSPEAIEALIRHSWPGNVRELRNMVCKALIFASGPCIAASDLPLPASEPAAPRGSAPGLNLDNVEREMVFKALTETGGHHDKAARMLGISRRTLSRKLKIYGASAELLESSVA